MVSALLVRVRTPPDMSSISKSSTCVCTSSYDPRVIVKMKGQKERRREDRENGHDPPFAQPDQQSTSATVTP